MLSLPLVKFKPNVARGSRGLQVEVADQSRLDKTLRCTFRNATVDFRAAVEVEAQGRHEEAE